MSSPTRPVPATAPATDGPAVRTRKPDLAAYATGSLGMGVWVTVPGLLLLYFLTHTLGVPAFIAGLTLLLPKVIDAVVHPLLGTASDREARRHGHRRGCCAGACSWPWRWWRCSPSPPG